MKQIRLPDRYSGGFRWKNRTPVSAYSLNKVDYVGSLISSRSVVMLPGGVTDDVVANVFYPGQKFALNAQATPLVATSNARGNRILSRAGVGGGYGSGLGFSSNYAALSGLTEFTIFFVARVINNNQGGTPLYMESSSGYAVGAGFDKTGFVATVRGGVWGARREIKLAVPDISKTYAVAMVWRGGNVLDAYINGAVGTDITSVYAENPTSTISDATSIGRYIYGTSPWSVGGELESVVTLRHAIPAIEALEWTRRPYRYMKRATPRSYFIPSAPATGPELILSGFAA